MTELRASWHERITISHTACCGERTSAPVGVCYERLRFSFLLDIKTMAVQMGRQPTPDSWIQCYSFYIFNPSHFFLLRHPQGLCAGYSCSNIVILYHFPNLQPRLVLHVFTVTPIQASFYAGVPDLLGSSFHFLCFSFPSPHDTCLCMELAFWWKR